jgi:hypothetical protein
VCVYVCVQFFFSDFVCVCVCVRVCECVVFVIVHVRVSSFRIFKPTPLAHTPVHPNGKKFQRSIAVLNKKSYDNSVSLFVVVKEEISRTGESVFQFRLSCMMHSKTALRRIASTFDHSKKNHFGTESIFTQLVHFLKQILYSV